MGGSISLQTQVNVDNGNHLINGRIDRKISQHHEHILGQVSSAEKNGMLQEMTKDIATGRGLSTEQHVELKKLSSLLGPDEVKAMVEKGRLSQESADLLIMAGGLIEADLSGDSLGRALKTFMSMNSDTQKYCVETMSDRSIERVANATKVSVYGIRADRVRFKEEHSEIKPDQQRLAIYLSSPQPRPLGSVQQFSTGEFSSSTATLTEAMSRMGVFSKLSPEQQMGAVNDVRSLGGAPAGPGEGPFAPGGDVKGPDHYAQMGCNDKNLIDLGSLMYQVLADRVSTLDLQVRSYAEAVQQKNGELKTLNNAMTVLRTNMNDNSKKDTDISELTFQDDSGKTRQLTGYLIDQGVAKDSTDFSKLSMTEVDNMLTSLKSNSDILSSDSTEAMTKLQQMMDKYNQATSTQTNFESKWNSSISGIIANQRG